jgi:GT2 family glycosyltransferase/glycosyltransferase involved in cell wall biosynthesis
MTPSLDCDTPTLLGTLIALVRELRKQVPFRADDAIEDGETEEASAFDEDRYLYLNPDVAELMRLGGFASGLEHWTKYGRVEGRAGGVQRAMPRRSSFVSELERKPFGVNLLGFLSTQSGLGTAARGCLQALESCNVPIYVVDVPPWSGGLDLRRPVQLPYRISLIQQNADMMERFVRAYGYECLVGSYNIGYWFWELPSLRSDWFSAFSYVDEVWAPSEFCRQSFQCLTSRCVLILPPVVDGLDRRLVHGRKHFGIPDDVFVFASIFDVSSQIERKNPFCLIKAFRQEFGDSKDVLLCLKFSQPQYDHTMVNRLEESIAGALNIRTFRQTLSDEEINSFQNVIDCLVSPHRSEGFGLNLAEAMYLGKPVIATRYSSNLDFMNDENSYLIDYKLTPINQNAGPYFKGSVWADPSVEDLACVLRRVFERRDEREQKGRAAARSIRERFNARRVGEIMRRRFIELGLDQTKVRRSILSPEGVPLPRLVSSTTPSDVVRKIRSLRHKPIISFITPVYNVDPAYLRACVESVKAQWYPFWELCLVDDASTNPATLDVLAALRGTDSRIKIIHLAANVGIAGASNRAAEISTGEYLAMLDHDDEVTPDALYEVAQSLNDHPDCDLAYTDEDKIECDGWYSEAYFKPDWSPEHLHSVMYLLHLLVVKKQIFYEVGEFRSEFSGAQDYDLALRISARSQAIHHIPKILYHWRKVPGSAAAQVDAKPAALEAGRRALEDHIRQIGADASVEPGKLPGLHRVRYRINGSPLVSLCIPTNDQSADIEGRGHINLLENFLRSIVAKTEYRNYEMLIVDRGNLSGRTRKALRDIPHRLISHPHKRRPFNFSERANYLFKHAEADYIVLLNDDLEVISPGWLSALLEHIQRPEIGVVGARLLFPNDRIQHVGVVLGVNQGAAHVYHNYPASLVGYNGFTHMVRNYIAVTGACLATRKDVIRTVGGFDTQFPIDYNDIDYCLRARECGYRIVYTPYAELYHFEGQSAARRAPDPTATTLFRERWKKYIENDPYYNPNLTRNALDYSIQSFAAADGTAL